MEYKMKNIILLVIIASSATACTSIKVQPISSDNYPDKICIEENPKVIVGDFLDIIRSRIESHGIDTEVYTNEIPDDCEYILTYTALKGWDFATYMHHAELHIDHNGEEVGYAVYHLKGKGGFSLMKWQGTKTKMDPVVDKLFGKE